MVLLWAECLPPAAGRYSGKVRRLRMLYSPLSNRAAHGSYSFRRMCVQRCTFGDFRRPDVRPGRVEREAW